MATNAMPTSYGFLEVGTPAKTTAAGVVYLADNQRRFFVVSRIQTASHPSVTSAGWQVYEPVRRSPEKLPNPPAISKSELEDRFRRLAKQWRRETAHLSSSTRMAMHPAYREIIGLGRQAVPLILRELQSRPGFWFAALREITGEDPVPADVAGNVPKMTAAWVKWGLAKGYIR